MTFRVRDLAVDVHPSSPDRLLLCAGTTDQQTDGCCQHPTAPPCPPPSGRPNCAPPSQQGGGGQAQPGEALGLLRSQLRQSVAAF